MSVEEEFKAYKEVVQKQLLKKSRKVSIVLAATVVGAVLFMIYGFTQSIESAKQRDIAIEFKELAQVREKEMILVKQAYDTLREKLAKCEAGK